MQASDTPIRLVVNADGFGADAAITRGTLRAHREGIVTSTSVIGISSSASSTENKPTTKKASDLRWAK